MSTCTVEVGAAENERKERMEGRKKRKGKRRKEKGRKEVRDFAKGQYLNFLTGIRVKGGGQGSFGAGWMTMMVVVDGSEQCTTHKGLLNTIYQLDWTRLHQKFFFGS